MKSTRNEARASSRPALRSLVLGSALACLIGTASAANESRVRDLLVPDDEDRQDLRGFDICDSTTHEMLRACQFQVRDTNRVDTAICLNLKNAAAKEACLEEAQDTRDEGFDDCEVVRDARENVCEAVGDGPYDPAVNPADFAANITNPYLPLRAGRWWEYRKTTPDGVERIRVEVLNTRRRIQGVNTTTLRDRVWLNGVLIEDTIDWAAQDKAGNVWYFGEIVQNFENGLLANLDGSFEAGRNGAKIGLLMKAAPRVGEFYRQEYALADEAEDVVEVLDLNAPDAVPFRNSGRVLKTHDFTPLAAGSDEFKFFVPGVGFVLEIDPASGERLELVDYGPR